MRACCRHRDVNLPDPPATGWTRGVPNVQEADHTINMRASGVRHHRLHHGLSGDRRSRTSAALRLCPDNVAITGLVASCWLPMGGERHERTTGCYRRLPASLPERGMIGDRRHRRRSRPVTQPVLAMIPAVIASKDLLIADGSRGYRSAEFTHAALTPSLTDIHAGDIEATRAASPGCRSGRDGSSSAPMMALTLTSTTSTGCITIMPAGFTGDVTPEHIFIPLTSGRLMHAPRS